MFSSVGRLYSRSSVVMWLLIWYIISSAVILQNKWILAQYPFPITLTTWHMVVITICTQIIARTTKMITLPREVDRRMYSRVFVPIGICFSMSVALSNMVYIYLSVAFIQMLKALGPVTTLLACWSIGLRNPPPSLGILFTVLIIVIGVVISSAGQIQYLATGILIQSAQIAFDAYKNALQQLSLNGKINLSPLAALYYFAPICTLSGVAGVVVFERGALQKAWPPKIPLWVVLSNGMITFSLNIVIGIMIKKTSSTTVSLLGIPKTMVAVVLDMLFYHTPVSFTQGLGFLISATGTLYYSQFRRPARPENSWEQAKDAEKIASSKPKCHTIDEFDSSLV